jgi:heme-degrading monooxygenase HmoA
MYATINRRTPNPARQQETLQAGAREFFPALEQAPGFVGFYLVAGEDGVNTATVLWQDRAHAEAFQTRSQQWGATLDDFGHRQESRTAGEVIHQVMPRP